MKKELTRKMVVMAVLEWDYETETETSITEEEFCVNAKMFLDILTRNKKVYENLTEEDKKELVENAYEHLLWLRVNAKN